MSGPHRNVTVTWGSRTWVHVATKSIPGVITVDRSDWCRLRMAQRDGTIGRVTIGVPGRNPYARVRLKANARVEYVHRWLLGTPSRHIDHVDGNTLNNVRANLRVCGHAENCRNSSVHSNSSTGLKGVEQDPRCPGKWSAYICPNGSKFHLGTFESPEQAARAYDWAAVGLYREYARTNFPLEEYSGAIA